MIEDLGMREYGSQGLKKRWWLVECPVCGVLFEAAAPNIKNGNTTRCKDCGKKASGQAAARKAANNFITNAMKAQTIQYDYSEVRYITSGTPVVIICREHGKFLQTPDDHLQGKKCPSCAGRPAKTTESFREDVVSLTNGEYTTIGTYISNKSKMTFKHNLCENEWETTPNTFLAGMRCPHCKNYKSSPSTPCILYYFKVTNVDESAWKIGITHTSVEDRYSVEELKHISGVRTWQFNTRASAREAERNILTSFSKYKYTGKPLLNAGNTELFTKDILKLKEYKIENTSTTNSN